MTGMAVVIQRMEVCDLCGSQENLTRYTIGKGGRPKKVALCPDHAATVEVILEKSKGKTGGRGAVRGTPTATIEEVEAAAKPRGKTRKRAAKSTG